MSGGRALDVLDAGMLTTVQDAGRPGLAHLGVPRSGWLDAGSARLANRLVGNPDLDGPDGGPGEALLECLGGGLALRTRTALTVALTGAPVDLRVDSRPVAYAEPVTVAAGATIALGRPTSGVRSYLAVAGGVRVPTVLGSRSTDTLSGIGPAPLAAGDELPVGPAPGPPAALDTPGRVGTSAPTATTTMLRVGPGPRADWFVDGLDALLGGAPYTVAGEADRIGVRLEGPCLARSVTAELPSEGLVLGAVQVPADGQPLVFLRDHPTTGGYPVVAVVHRDDLDRVAQLRPGDAVRFRRG
ncbi:biotin-dependent carboxyltransferase family protein [Nocardioides sp. HDW12B]|uniref:5-oxoprolinase subunit C family protein n=1 Tax=Nocardioides sp. HDW12B TaxID=2714939 RepID=UPI001409E0A0|nr:biotin-dependent carboxyltransferase family protein [Nocardioides sp. HDW12B]QIK66794.1 biotin-dependent carboxyltransferase family protein [Nocardioides sp. HDW12B]